MALNKGLGRGLAVLLGERNDKVSGNLLQIPLDDIVPGVYQPRKSFNENSLYELADSIKRNGILQPIVVVRHNEGYAIIAGERRWRASKIAGLTTIPVLLRDIKSQEMLEYALIENIQRENLNIIEEAEGYLRLMGEFGYTQEELSSIVNKSRSHVANILRLNTLPSSIKQKIVIGEISMGHGRALVGRENAEEIATQIIDKGLNVRQTEELVRNWNAEAGANYGRRKESHSELSGLVLGLSQKFGVKVRIEENNNSGRLVFCYDNLEELDRLLEQLMGY